MRAGLPKDQVRVLQLETARRSVVAGVFHVIGFAVFYYATPFPTGRPLGSLLAFASMWLSAVLRAVVYLVDRRYLSRPKDAARWERRGRLFFRAVILWSGATWGLLAVPILVQYGTSLPSFIILAIEPAIALLSIEHFGVDLLLVRSFIVAVMGPAMVTLLSTRSPGSLTLGFGYAIYITFLLYLAKRAQGLLLEALASRATIQRQRAELVAVLEAFPGFVVWLDPQGKIQGQNDALARTYGRSSSELLGRDVEDATHDTALGELLRSFREATRTEDLREVELAPPSGARWVLVALKKYGDPESPHALAIGLDIAEKKRAELERDQAQAAAYQSSQLAELGIMAAGIGHEINNPLQALRYCLELVKDTIESFSPTDREEVADVLRLTTRATTIVQRIAAIVQALRSFAQRTPSNELETVCVHELLDEIGELASATLPHGALALRIDPPPPNLALRARRVQLEQVLLNLLNNARDAVAVSPEKWIHVATRDLGDDIELSVEDSGPGIAAPLRDRIMLPFFTTKGPGRGTGLGLSISKSIVERHHGRFFLDTKAEHTRFVIVLPKNGVHDGDPASTASRAPY